MSFIQELKSQSLDLWERGYQHPFVQELGAGTLPQSTFQFYLIQDYHYLLAYGKVFAIGASKAETESLMTRFTEVQHAILTKELAIHRAYMADFGISNAAITESSPALFNRSYTSSMLATAQNEGIASILATILPCAWTYGDYAQRLKTAYPQSQPSHPYHHWLDGYSSPDYQAGNQWLFDTLEELVSDKKPAEKEKLAAIFKTSLEFELLFWEMSYHRQQSYQ